MSSNVACQRQLCATSLRGTRLATNAFSDKSNGSSSAIRPLFAGRYAVRMTRPDWAPDDIDISVPSAARMYDYYLGGAHNFAADRELAEKALAAIPDGRDLARANRAFLQRSVRFLAQAGVRQFLDIGSGIPTVGNVHEVVQEIAPEARVVYVDIDPVAVSHARALLADNRYAIAIRGDLREPGRVLADPQLRELLDLGRPVAVLLLAVLHFVGDADGPEGIIEELYEAVAPGSYLVISHGTDDGRSTEELEHVYRRTVTPLAMRSRAEVVALFGRFALIDPGVVWAPEWHPDQPGDLGEHPERSSSYVAVGRKE
jgi:SAM-dependent methyltransferase